MSFLHDGCPRMEIEAKWKPPQVSAPRLPRAGRRNRRLLQLLGTLNTCSREYKSRMYDSEVKGLSVIKPFVGVFSDTPSDATVCRIDYSSREGVAIAEGINPFYSDIDTYHMMAGIIDEGVRRIISVGGRLGHIAGLDNFCWPDPVLSKSNPDGPYKMAQLVRANKALYDLTTAYQVPCISGKDSMKNDSVRGGKKISIPPTVLFSTIGKVDDIHCTATMDFKRSGDFIYVLGLTKAELGASEYYRALAKEQGHPEAIGGDVPTVDVESAFSLYQTMDGIHQQGWFHSVHTPTLGGLGRGFALCSLGGNLGADIDLGVLDCAGKLTDDQRLFSESHSRFIVTCAPENAPLLETALSSSSFCRVGTVNATSLLNIQGVRGTQIVSLHVADLRKAFKETLHGI